MLKVCFRHKPRRLSKADLQVGQGPDGRISKMRKVVTGLIRHERIEGKHQHIDEARGYAERLLYLASSKGKNDEEMQRIADYWLIDKDLIPKLFDVLVPRYENQKGSYTKLHRLPSVYPEHRGRQNVSLLELKGNPWPPMPSNQAHNDATLINVLLREAKKDYRAQKYKEFSEMREMLHEQQQAVTSRVDDVDSQQVLDDESSSHVEAQASSVEQTDSKQDKRV